uniref:MI domain-containing protein n=1 Tax=Calidris pygmaea TaxID=425635 RepID=A0A8C3KDZ1_9CHAR
MPVTPTTMRQLRYGPTPSSPPHTPSPAFAGSPGSGGIILSPQGDTVYATVVPELEEGELEKNVQPMVMEYFEHGDTSEVMELLRGLNLGSRRHAVPSLAVALALEGKASHRELTSRLLSDLVGHVVTPEDIAWAFDKMLQDLPDLILDTPEAPQMLGQFIARAVADHALPLDFLERYKGRVDCEHARAALDRAAVLLRIKRDVNRLDNVWGVGGGQRPVKHLVKEVSAWPPPRSCPAPCLPLLRASSLHPLPPDVPPRRPMEALLPHPSGCDPGCDVSPPTRPCSSNLQLSLRPHPAQPSPCWSPCATLVSPPSPCPCPSCLCPQMNLLLREYLLSGEVSEAEHCLRELEVPHFHHELVYEVRAGSPGGPGGGGASTCSPANAHCPQAVVMVLEGSGEGPVAMMVTLLKVLWETGLVTLDQMNRVSVGHAEGGSVSSPPPGLTLPCPVHPPRPPSPCPGLPAGVRGAGGHQPGRAAGPQPPGAAGGALLRPRHHHQGAAGRLPRQVPREVTAGEPGGRLEGWLPPFILLLLHCRGRKRFVSEGDGGQVKQ